MLSITSCVISLWHIFLETCLCRSFARFLILFVSLQILGVQVFKIRYMIYKGNWSTPSSSCCRFILPVVHLEQRISGRQAATSTWLISSTALKSWTWQTHCTRRWAGEYGGWALMLWPSKLQPVSDHSWEIWGTERWDDWPKITWPDTRYISLFFLPVSPPAKYTRLRSGLLLWLCLLSQQVSEIWSKYLNNRYQVLSEARIQQIDLLGKRFETDTGLGKWQLSLGNRAVASPHLIHRPSPQEGEPLSLSRAHQCHLLLFAEADTEIGKPKGFHQCWEEFRALVLYTAFPGAHKVRMWREKDLQEPPVISAEPPFLQGT